VESTEYVCIGRIGKPFQVRGKVRVVPMTDFPERFRETREVYLSRADGKRTLCRVEDAEVSDQRIVLKLGQVDSREEAAALRGQFVEIPRNEVMPLEEDSYYIYDLLGCEVVAEDKGRLGTVKEVITRTGNDILVVNGRPEGKEVLIPVIGDVVKKVDIKNQRIDIVLLKGLL